MPIALNCQECARSMRVPDESAGKKIKCPGCQAVNVVPAATGGKPEAAPPTFAAACPNCNKKMKLPMAASGKSVRCPSCQSSFTAPVAAPESAPVAKAGVAKANPQVAPAKLNTAARTAPQPAAATAIADPFSGPSLPVDDDLFSERDFEVTDVGSVPRKIKVTEVDVGEGPARPRSKKVYFIPGVCTLTIGVLNFIASVVLIIIAVVTVSKMPAATVVAFIWAGIIGVICVGEAVRIVLGGLAVIERESRPAVFAAIAEMMLSPVGGLFLASNSFSWTVSFIIAGVFVVLVWPIAIWLIVLTAGEQGKIDFGDLTKDDLEEQAQQLRRKAAGLGGGGH